MSQQKSKEETAISLTLAFLRRINYNKCAALQQKQTQEIEFLWLSTVS